MYRISFCLALCGLLALSSKGRATEITGMLSGAQEVPPNSITPATGTFSGDLEVNGSMALLTFTVTYSDLIGGLVLGANFHDAPAGSNGPDVRDYDPAPFTSPDGSFMGTWSSSDAQPLTPALVSDLLSGNIYFDIQTQQFPAGEIRGQLTPVPEPSSLGLAVGIGVGLALARLQGRWRKR
jgi:hypothetical protein